MPRKRAVTLMKPKAKPPKGRTKAVGFRAPPDVREYLDYLLEKKGTGDTESVLHLFRLGRDAEKEIGEEFDEALRRMSRMQDVSVGQIIGRLARRALERKSKK